MAEILHEFPIRATADRVFEAMTTPAGLDQWWTHDSSGVPGPAADYSLGFGPEYGWEARVTRSESCGAISSTVRVSLTNKDWKPEFTLTGTGTGTGTGTTPSRPCLLRTRAS